MKRGILYKTDIPYPFSNRFMVIYRGTICGIYHSGKTSNTIPGDDAYCVWEESVEGRAGKQDGSELICLGLWLKFEAITS